MHRQIDVGSIAAAGAAVAFLLATREGGLVTAQSASTDFIKSMEAAMTSTLEAFDLQRSSLPAAAAAIVTALDGMEDPIHHYGQAQHGFSFACVVWPFHIRADFASHDILKYGKGDKYMSLYAVNRATNGAVPFHVCKSPVYPSVPEVGPLGWPCPSGGSVCLTSPIQDQTPHNGLAFFFPTADKLQKVIEKLLWFRSTVSTCLKRPLFAVWAFNEIAACVYQTDLKNPDHPESRSKSRNYRLHGIAVFPIYKCTGSEVERSESFGLSAEEGRVFLEEVKVTSGSSETPLDQLCIASVALLPFGKI